VSATSRPSRRARKSCLGLPPNGRFPATSLNLSLARHRPSADVHGPGVDGRTGLTAATRGRLVVCRDRLLAAGGLHSEADTRCYRSRPAAYRIAPSRDDRNDTLLTPGNVASSQTDLLRLCRGVETTSAAGAEEVRGRWEIAMRISSQLAAAPSRRTTGEGHKGRFLNCLLTATALVTALLVLAAAPASVGASGRRTMR
jgi:hypothetical protein